MTVALVVNNLRAEGGPALAADLAAEWLDQTPVLLALNDQFMEFADRFDALGVPVEVLGVKAISGRNPLRIAASVAAALARHKATSIVSIPNGVHGAIFAGAKIAGIKKRVVHMGNYPWHWCDDFWKYRLLMRLSAPLTPDMVCVTGHVARGVEKHFGHVARRVHVIANGIDVRRFAFRGLPSPVQGRPIEILMIARIDAGKDHHTLLDAIHILHDASVPVRLTIVGDGDLRDEVQRRAAPLMSSVCFLGARQDVPALLGAADVFAFSVQPEEGLGIALLEAMAIGVPVVATDVGACREVLDSGRCGTLVPPRNPAALAEALVRAAQLPNMSQIKTARARVEKAYSRGAMASAYGRICGFR